MLLPVFLTAVLISGGAWAARRIPFLFRSTWRPGIFLGLLGILAGFLRNGIWPDYGLIALGDAAALTAAFIFGPQAGLAAGGITAAGEALALFGGFQAAPWSGVAGSLTVTLYAAGISQWVFERKRPQAVPVFLAAFLGELLYLPVAGFTEMLQDNPAGMLDLVRAAYPLLPSGTAVTVGLASLCCARQDRRGNFSASVAGMILLAGSFWGICSAMYHNAEQQTCSTLQAAARKLHDGIEDQIGYMLHCNAASLVKQFGTARPLSVDAMRDYAADYDVDEVNLFTNHGKLLASNLLEVEKYNHRPQTALGPLREFLELTAGTRHFVKQDFRPSRSDRTNVSKYVGVALPDRTAFLQMGYTWKRLEREFSTFFFPMFSTMSIVNAGCFIVTDPAGKIAAPVAGHAETAGKSIQDAGMTEKERNTPPGTVFSTRLFDEDGHALRCKGIGPWRIYAFLPDSVYFAPEVALASLICTMLFILVGMFRFAVIRMVRAQKKINDMRAADMTLAATIQQSELPSGKFANAYCTIAARMTPAKEVGGDFYDHYELDEDRTAVTIADVSGKGIPAAIFMMKAKNTLHGFVSRNVPIAESMQAANDRLNRNNQAAMFVTAWLGIFDRRTGILEFVSAGHNPPLVLRADGRAEWLASALEQPPLAVFGGETYRKESVRLAPGDTLFLYTDGVTEAQNVKRELYGEERLAAELDKAPADPIRSVARAVDDFIAGAPVADDITMLTLKIKNT